MAIINNHSSINLDAEFQGEHSELLQFFFNQGLNVEISDHVADLKTFLESLSDEEYPYNFDAAFNESFIDKEGFVLSNEGFTHEEIVRLFLSNRRGIVKAGPESISVKGSPAPYK